MAVVVLLAGALIGQRVTRPIRRARDGTRATRARDDLRVDVVEGHRGPVYHLHRAVAFSP